MSKSLSRDVQVLQKILKYLNKMSQKIKQYNCSSLYSFSQSEDCRDVCSFYILQISELSKMLTKDSYNSLPFLCNGSIVAVRNMIAHDYVGLQIPMLYSFVASCISSQSYKAVKDRLRYCLDNKRG